MTSKASAVLGLLVSFLLRRYFTVMVCDLCGNDMKYYDSVRRIVRGKYGKTKWIRIKRFKCSICGSVRRKLPNYILPYKQYESEIIMGVLEGFITCETLGYEDFPCEMTMLRWKSSRKLQLLL